MPAAEPSSLLEAPMMGLSDPIDDLPAMTLDTLVEQMMDLFNMMGPMM